MATLLSIVQEACDRIGLVRPTAVVGSSDDQARQLLSLSNQDGKDLVRRHDWQKITKEKTITATATEEQTSGIPDDFARMIPGTFWNRTQDRRVAGPLSAQRWQQLKSGLIVLPFDAFRIRGNALLMNPTPTASDSLAYEYVSTCWCSSTGETAPDQAAWVADTDLTYLDDELQVLGLCWRYKRARGLDFSQEFDEYETRLAHLNGVDGVQADLDMALGDDGSSVSAPYVQDGNWSIN
jgi:hypothetical protein